MNSLQLASPTISKKETELLAQQLIESLPEGVSPTETYAKLQKLKHLAETAMSVLKQTALDSIGDDGEIVLGGKLSWAGGGKAFSGKDSFGHNPKWVEATEEVKRIEGLMKLAEKHPERPLYDDEGEEVPGALASTRSAYLKYMW